MSGLSIKTKFTIVSVAAIVVIAFAALYNYFTLQDMIAQAARTATASTLLRQHLDGDMMHDAIRADVLTATLGVRTKDAVSIAGSKADATEHGARFLDNLKKNLALDLPADIHALFVAEEPTLKAYNDQAAKYITAAVEDAKNGTNRTEALYPDFEDAFEELEETQGELSDKIEAYSGRLKDLQVAAASAATTYALVLALVTIAITAAIPIFARFALFTPQAALMEAMNDLARGSRSVSIPYADRSDEVGAMATALLVFQRNAEEKIRLEEEQTIQAKRNEEDRRKGLLDLADSFERRVGELVKGVAAAATQLQATAQTMSSTSQGATTQAGAVAHASEQTAQNSSTVASATEELSASFAEINRRMIDSSGLIAQAVSQTVDASSKVKRLDDAARKIGEVVKLIGSVAEQTNLLALNATIEAARAGEAGKGFAVVASEVKTLATQTAKATSEVEVQIKAIQAAVMESTTAMDAVNASIGKVSDISSAITSSVAQQAEATVSIAQNISESSRGVSEIQANISGVLRATEAAGAAATQVLAAAGELSRSGESLSTQVDAFVREVRAG